MAHAARLTVPITIERRSMRMRMRVRDARDESGASLVEYIILVGMIGLVALVGFRMFGVSVRNATDRKAECVASLDAGCTSTQRTNMLALAATSGAAAVGSAPQMQQGVVYWAKGIAKGIGREAWDAGKGLAGLGFAVSAPGQAYYWANGKPNPAVRAVVGLAKLAASASPGGRLVAALGGPDPLRDTLHGIGRSIKESWKHDKAETVGRGIFEVATIVAPYAKVKWAADAAKVEEVATAGEEASRVAQAGTAAEASAIAEKAPAAEEGVVAASKVSQAALKAAVDGRVPSEFIKDAPVMGYRIQAGDTLESLPPVIRDNLGAVDATQYTPEYFRQNADSIIAMQWNKGKPDFYVVGKDTFNSSYQTVSSSEVATKNPKLFNGLSSNPDVAALVNSGDGRVVGALKTTPVKMVKMSDAGFPVNEPVTIESPWGDVQTKPAGQDAFIVLDGDSRYMVNVGPDGNPISYIPRKQP